MELWKLSFTSWIVAYLEEQSSYVGVTSLIADSNPLITSASVYGPLARCTAILDVSLALCNIYSALSWQ